MIQVRIAHAVTGDTPALSGEEFAPTTFTRSSYGIVDNEQDESNIQRIMNLGFKGYDNSGAGFVGGGGSDWGDGTSGETAEDFWRKIIFTALLTSGNTTLFSTGTFSCNFGGGASSDGDGDGNRLGKGPVGPFTDDDSWVGSEETGSTKDSKKNGGSGSSKNLPKEDFGYSTTHQVGDERDFESVYGDKFSFKGFTSIKAGTDGMTNTSLVYFNGVFKGVKFSYGPLSTMASSSGVLTHSITLNGYSLGQGSDGTISIGHSNNYHPNASNGVQLSYRPGYLTLAGVVMATFPQTASFILPRLAIQRK